MGFFGALFSGGGTTPLHKAAGTGDVGAANALLMAGADVNAKNSYGDTPLIWASRGGHLDVVQLLVESGADVNAKDRTGMTALFHAVVCCRFVGDKVTGHWAIIQFLLHRGADPNCRDLSADSPLLWALKNQPRLAVILQREDDFRLSQAEMMGIDGKATLSKSGRPVCPKCHFEFPVPAATMRNESDGIPMFVCPTCSSRIQL